jgi:hypothetical protein
MVLNFFPTKPLAGLVGHQRWGWRSGVGTGDALKFCFIMTHLRSLPHMYMYVYICMYICTYSACLYIYIHTYIFYIYTFWVLDGFFVSMRQRMSACVSMRQHASAHVSIRQHVSVSAYVSMRQHASACVGIRQLSDRIHMWSSIVYPDTGYKDWLSGCMTSIASSDTGVSLSTSLSFSFLVLHLTDTDI